MEKEKRSLEKSKKILEQIERREIYRYINEVIVNCDSDNE